MNTRNLRLAIRNILLETFLNEEASVIFDAEAIDVQPIKGTVEFDEDGVKVEPTKKKTKPAKNWKEYIVQTAEKYKGSLYDGKEVDAEYLKDFVEKYRQIVNTYLLFVKLLKTEEDKDNEIAKKMAEILSDPKIMGFSPDMDDSFGAFKKWYMTFNKTETAAALREADVFEKNSKYLSAIAVAQAIDTAEELMDGVVEKDGKPKETLQVPPEIKEKPEAEQKAAVEGAKKKLGAKVKEKLAGASKALAAKFKPPEPKEEETKKGDGTDPRDENYAWTLSPEGVPMDHPAMKALDADGDGTISQMDLTKWNLGGKDKYLASVGQKKFRAPGD